MHYADKQIPLPKRGRDWTRKGVTVGSDLTAEALDTGVANIERTRRQLVEEGFESVLTRKYNPNSARPRIFDGVAEAKLIALTCGPALAGHANGAFACLRKRSSNSISLSAPVTTRLGGRSKKHPQAASPAAMGDRARRQRGFCRQHGRLSRTSSLTEAKLPARITSPVRSAKKRSTRLSQDEEVGVKCILKRGCLSSHAPRSSSRVIKVDKQPIDELMPWSWRQST